MIGFNPRVSSPQQGVFQRAKNALTSRRTQSESGWASSSKGGASRASTTRSFGDARVGILEEQPDTQQTGASSTAASLVELADGLKVDSENIEASRTLLKTFLVSKGLMKESETVSRDEIRAFQRFSSPRAASVLSSQDTDGLISFLAPSEQELGSHLSERIVRGPDSFRPDPGFRRTSLVLDILIEGGFPVTPKMKKVFSLVKKVSQSGNHHDAKFLGKLFDIGMKPDHLELDMLRDAGEDAALNRAFGRIVNGEDGTPNVEISEQFVRGLAKMKEEPSDHLISSFLDNFWDDSLFIDDSGNVKHLDALSQMGKGALNSVMEKLEGKELRVPSKDSGLVLKLTSDFGGVVECFIQLMSLDGMAFHGKNAKNNVFSNLCNHHSPSDAVAFVEGYLTSERFDALPENVQSQIITDARKLDYPRLMEAFQAQGIQA